MITTDTIDLCLNLFGAVKLDPSAPEFEKAALAFIKAKNELVEERARIESGRPGAGPEDQLA